tara:strand:+ start:516 stop:872 length:357 start_codon:yes stop_codon:yes gene_type:complete
METQQPKEEKSKLETKITKQLSKTFKQTKSKQTKPKQQKEKKVIHKCSPGAVQEMRVTSRCSYCNVRKSICYIHQDTEGPSEDGYECEKCGRGLIIGFRSLGGRHTCRQKPNFSARRR